MIVACDVGLKRIGLAGYIGGVVLPMEPIIRKNRHQAAQELSNFLELKKASILAVGLPSAQDENLTPMYHRIRHFMGLVKFQGKIVYVNEDYSSIEAFEDILYMGKKSRRQACKNGKIDSLAACKILERYLKSI